MFPVEGQCSGNYCRAAIVFPLQKIRLKACFAFALCVFLTDVLFFSRMFLFSVFFLGQYLDSRYHFFGRIINGAALLIHFVNFN